ncbi:MAG TPA: VWA domain-containing protein [Thermoanaerobaculia bacterium]
MKRLVVSLVALILVACNARREHAAQDSGAMPRDPDAVHLVFTFGSEKEAWIRAVTDAFNNGDHKTAAGKRIEVEAIPMGSGDCIDELLTESRKAHLTSPASAAFITLANAQSRTKTGKDLIARTENLVLSPVVITMWKPMAEALGWPSKPVGWSDVLALSRNPQGWASVGHPEWGPFRFGHTHPESSNSGLISILAEIYAATGKKSGLTIADVEDPKNAEFVRGIEQAVVHYGSSTGFFGKKMFANGPRYLSAAVLYENMVIDANVNGRGTMPFPVVAIYPKEGTFWSDHPVGIVERPWVTPVEREAAKLYIDYLLAREQQEKAIPFGFRPGAVDVPVAAPIDATNGVDPLEPKTTLEVPSASVMDAVLRMWRSNKKTAHVTLVLDVSGSMEDDRKMDNARDGSLQLVELLHDADEFTLVPFNDDVRPSIEASSLATGRSTANDRIRGLYADGGTALYDAIDVAYQKQLSRRDVDRGKITSIVVLSDGEDRDSKMKLDALLDRIRFDNETRTIRVFTIGYGRDAKKDVLEKIADATQAKYYEGNPQNIRAILREIATFF